MKEEEVHEGEHKRNTKSGESYSTSSVLFDHCIPLQFENADDETTSRASAVDLCEGRFRGNLCRLGAESNEEEGERVDATAKVPSHRQGECATAQAQTQVGRRPMDEAILALWHRTFGSSKSCLQGPSRSFLLATILWIEHRRKAESSTDPSVFQQRIGIFPSLARQCRVGHRMDSTLGSRKGSNVHEIRSGRIGTTKELL